MTTPYTPKHTNLVSMLQSSVESFSDRPLFGFEEGNRWRWIDYKTFGSYVDHCRAGLASIGIDRGDRVAVISDNCLEWVVCAFATYSLSAVYIPIYANQLERDWKYILHDCDAKVCFVGNSAVESRVRLLHADLHSLEYIISFSNDTSHHPSYADLIEKGKANPVRVKSPSRRTVATFIYTAGARGDPKGVILTHYNLTSNCSALVEALNLTPDKEERTFAFLPWAHVFGGAIELNTMISSGGSIAIAYSSDDILKQLPVIKPTILFTVPRIWYRVCAEIRKQIMNEPAFYQNLFLRGVRTRSKKTNNEPLVLGERFTLLLADRFVFSKIRDKFGGRLSHVLSGAAALSDEIAEFSNDIGIPIYQGYGMTECSGCATSSNPRVNKPGSVGKPISGVTILLDKNVDEANGEEGEIIIFGMGVMKGYHNMPDTTLEVMTKYGGIRSGDIGYIDQDGFLFITGTTKELFKLANGRYVAPAPLEESLQRSQYIEQCFIYGTNQSYTVALIVPDMVSLHAWAKGIGLSPFVDTLLQDQQTRALIMEEIAKCSREFKFYERIRDFTLISRKFSVDDGTLTPTLEYKRAAIVEMYSNELKKMYIYKKN